MSVGVLKLATEGTHMVDPAAYPGTPRWVKVFGIIALLVVLLFVILLFARGPHRGPGDHSASGGGGGGHTPRPGVRTPPGGAHP
jgi:hypothetical protein